MEKSRRARSDAPYLFRGIARFFGSAATGLLYDKLVLAVAIFSMILLLNAIPVILIANKRR